MNQRNSPFLFEMDIVVANLGNRASTIRVLFWCALVFTACGTYANRCPSAFPPDTNEEINPSEINSFILSDGEKYPWQSSTLPLFVRPTNYTLSLHANLTTLDVTGWVIINFVVDNETQFIVFHAAENINITEKWVREGTSQTNSGKTVSKLLEYAPFQQRYLELSPENSLVPGKTYSLGIRFRIKLSSEFAGFYISGYITPQGETRVFAATQFESNFARTVFPCFDEPVFKSTFKVTIIRDMMYKSMTNMPIERIETVYYGYNMELMRDEFEQTPAISASELGFIICDYESMYSKASKGTDVIVHTVPQMLNRVKFANETAVFLMTYYEDFFGIPYPLPKYDLITIPDFGAKPTSVPGLTFFREREIFYDLTESTTKSKQSVVTVIARRMAFQWFGTTGNEGLATLVSYGAINSILPESRIMDQFVLETAQPALEYDINTSHQNFDVSQSKEAAVLRMFEFACGENGFRVAVRQYLEQLKSSNFSLDEFWPKLICNLNGSIDVMIAMDSWMRNPGYPLVRVKLKNGTIFVQHEQLIIQSNNHINRSVPKPMQAVSENSWLIPLSYVTSAQPSEIKFIWLNKSLEFSLPNGSDWIKLNKNQNGFYRTQYEGNLWNNLIQVLLTKPNTFSPADRANLIDDAFSLSNAGILSAEIPLKMSKYLLKETEYIPWATALKHFRSWRTALQEKPVKRLLDSYLCNILNPIYRMVGWADVGSHLTRLLRAEVLAAIVECGNEYAIQEAKIKFWNWRRMRRLVPPNLREIVFFVGVKFGDQSTWDECWSQFKSSQDASERRILLKALSSTCDPYILEQFLDASMNPEIVRPDEVETIFGAVAANPAGRLLVWRQLRANWDHINAMLSRRSHAMGSLVSVVIKHYSSEFDYNEVITFFTRRSVDHGQGELDQSLNRIRLNIETLSKHEKVIEAWLAQEAKLN